MMDNGLITMESRRSVPDTVDGLATIVREKGLTVFARIDHAANARAAGLDLRPTEMIMFGNPQAGTPLMQNAQTAGIDLPVRVVVWQDESGKVWLSYNDPKWMARRHGIAEDAQMIAAIDAGMKLVCGYATRESP